MRSAKILERGDGATCDESLNPSERVGRYRDALQFAETLADCTIDSQFTALQA